VRSGREGLLAGERGLDCIATLAETVGPLQVVKRNAPGHRRA
jgi:hypothetical protein